MFEAFLSPSQARDMVYQRILADAIRASDMVDAMLTIRRAHERVVNAPSIDDLVASNPVYRAHMATIAAPQV